MAVLFQPSNTAFVCLVDPFGVPYKAGSGGGGGGTTVTTFSNSIALGDTSSIITHNLGDAAAILLAAFPNWNSGEPYITAQDANTITVTFPNECSLSSGGQLVGGVIPS
jgi:hypothetical protein